MGIKMHLEKLETSIYIEGDIYHEHAKVLRAIINDRVQSGCKLIRLNMASVYYIDCQGLRLLAALQSEVKQNGITLRFDQARDWTKRLDICVSCWKNRADAGLVL